MQNYPCLLTARNSFVPLQNAHLQSLHHWPLSNSTVCFGSCPRDWSSTDDIDWDTIGWLLFFQSSMFHLLLQLAQSYIVWRWLKAHCVFFLWVSLKPFNTFFCCSHRSGVIHHIKIVLVRQIVACITDLYHHHHRLFFPYLASHVEEPQHTLYTWLTTEQILSSLIQALKDNITYTHLIIFSGNEIW